MLTGKRAFDGEDVSDTLAAVLRGEPDWAALPAEVPAAIRTLLQRCLAKDRRQRIADIAVALFRPRRPRERRARECRADRLRDNRATTTALAARGSTRRHVAHRRGDGGHRRLVRHARHQSAAPRVALSDHPAERGGAGPWAGSCTTSPSRPMARARLRRCQRHGALRARARSARRHAAQRASARRLRRSSRRTASGSAFSMEATS